SFAWLFLSAMSGLALAIQNCISFLFVWGPRGPAAVRPAGYRGHRRASAQTARGTTHAPARAATVLSRRRRRPRSNRRRCGPPTRSRTDPGSPRGDLDGPGQPSQGRPEALLTERRPPGRKLVQRPKLAKVLQPPLGHPGVVHHRRPQRPQPRQVLDPLV